MTWVFVAMALFGSGRAFWMPASQAMVVNLVPLRTAPGLGAAVTAVWLARRPITRHAGAGRRGDMISVFVRPLPVQLETPDAIRGRVSAVSALSIGSSPN